MRMPIVEPPRKSGFQSFSGLCQLAEFDQGDVLARHAVSQDRPNPISGPNVREGGTWGRFFSGVRSIRAAG